MYLTTPCEEKIWTTLGPEFGLDKGKRALIVHALYGLSSAGASFSRHLADCMRALGYSSCKADADLWYKPMTRPDDNVPYYAYVLLYIDDCMAISHDVATTLREIDKFFPMKPGPSVTQMSISEVSYKRSDYQMESSRGQIHHPNMYRK